MKMTGKKRNIYVFILCFLVLAPCCFFGYVYYKVTRDAMISIERGVIDRVIASESPIFYDDGRTPIGAFFEKTHRKYIHYKEIPKIFVKALIASEDRNFFHHGGFDPKAMLRALLANLKMSKVVQGGSTLTQQTAKNIFKREKRSYKAKIKELIQAFLLERKYTKEEIIEMYVNQFFVTGYGKGLRIAAQYYFAKETKDLDLVEAAFIAGSLKAPNRYNPFIKKNEAERQKACQAAKSRKDYVLSNMLKMHFITRDQYLKAKETEVPFKEGKITYRLNVILDYIREQLDSSYFKAILHEQGVDNIATSGISIHTSINKEIQEAALASLRSHLPLMDVMLNGYSVSKMTDTYQELLKNGLKKSEGTLPFLSRITHIDAHTGNSHLVVGWDNGGGIIDYEGLKPMGEAWLKWKSGSWAVFDKKHVPAFLKNFHVGDLVPVQLFPASKTSLNDDRPMKLMLSKIPELEGGIVVLRKGMVRAMVGGFFDRFFNRAVDAKRQMGSIFKPIVYTAALQLKWNSLDPLQNMREVFQFETTTYLPQPDHKPRSKWVSMVWAGVKSENLATVWLLYHLTDHLNTSEFHHIAQLVGLDREGGESYQTYKKRIRDQYGVVVNRDALMEAAFEEAKNEVESDIIFGGHEETLNNLDRLQFNINSENLDAETPEEKQATRFSFEKLREFNLKMKGQFHQIGLLLDQYSQNNTPGARERLSKSLRHFYRTDAGGSPAKIVYAEDVGLLPVPLFQVTPEWIRAKPFVMGEILIDGLVTSETIDLLQENMKRNYERLVTEKYYSMEVLSRVRDFRTLVNLYYVVYLSKRMGISTKLDPVLSFPLGPDSISISEAALAYQAIMSGHIYPLSHKGGPTMIPIITKIVDRDGEVLWEYKAKPKKILTDRVSGLVTEILRKVMEIGTGRRARDEVQLFDVPIPTFGKTGTANRFTNSSFVGFIPGPKHDAGQLDSSDGYVIASYVGYDDNRPMKGPHITIYGASGALPLWIDTANAIANTAGYKKDLQPADLVFEPISTPFLNHGDFRIVPVSPVSGLPVSPSDQGVDISSAHRILAEAEKRGNKTELKRHFEPIERAVSSQ